MSLSATVYQPPGLIKNHAFHGAIFFSSPCVIEFFAFPFAVSTLQHSGDRQAGSGNVVRVEGQGIPPRTTHPPCGRSAWKGVSRPTRPPSPGQGVGANPYPSPHFSATNKTPPFSSAFSAVTLSKKVLFIWKKCEQKTAIVYVTQ